MKRKLIFRLLAIVGGVILFASCEYDFIEAPAPPPPPEPGDTTYFAADVAPVFETDGCTACHNGGMAFDLTAPNAYDNIISYNLVVAFDPDQSKIYTYPHPQTGSHNSKYKSNASVNTIYNWIMQGALDN